MPLASISRLKVLNVRELVTHWGRAVASVVVVAVSAALLVAVLGVSGSITGSIDRLATSIGGNADREYFIYHRNHTERNAHIGVPVRSRSATARAWSMSRDAT